MKVRRLLRNYASQARSLREFLRDGLRYRQFSTPTGDLNFDALSPVNRECQITKEYHRIEKGLALESPRRPFGAEPRMRLELLLSGRTATEAHEMRAAEALIALEEWNDKGLVDDQLAPPGSQWDPSEEEMRTFHRFFESRRSVRTFAPRPVDVAAVAEAVMDAGRTPSVCNRQPWRAHLYEAGRAQEVLQLHNGSAAFAKSVPSILVVTARTGMFSGTGERNQRWVDGGMFAMTLVWALHARGLATCFLNWSRDNDSTRKLREVSEIPADEDVIVIIAVGHPAPSHRVARSPRRDIADLLIPHL